MTLSTPHPQVPADDGDRRLGRAGLDRSIWSLVNQATPVPADLVRWLLSLLFVGYAVLWAVRCWQLGGVEMPRVRLTVLAYTVAGIVCAPRLAGAGLRAYLIGLAALLGPGTFYVTAVEDYPADRLSLCVLAVTVPLLFMQTARDGLVSIGLTLVLCAGVMAEYPPTAMRPATVWVQLAGALLVGAAGGSFLIVARAVMSEGLDQWQRVYDRERRLRAVADAIASTVDVEPLGVRIAADFQSTLADATVFVVLDRGTGWRLVGGAGPAGEVPAARAATVVAQVDTLAEWEPRPVQVPGAPPDVQALVVPVPSFAPARVVLLRPGGFGVTPDLRDLWKGIAERAGVGFTNAVAREQLREQEARDRELAADQRRLVELRSQFVAQASHQFRTPLAVIRSATDALRRYHDRMNPEQRTSRFEKIDAAVRAMAELLDDVLAYGRADAGLLRCTPERVDVAALCRDVLADCRATASRTHDLVLECAAETVDADVDPSLVRHVLDNLVGNAIKYSPAGGPVRVRVERSTDGLLLQVHDRGLGIPAEDQPRLFEPFQRGGNVGEVPGTGLGLAIARAAVLSHGGSITVASAVGEGTTFTVRLPDQG